MSLDGIATYALADEINKTLSGGKTEKIFQPEKDKIVLNIRNNKNYKLLLSVNPQGARINITDNTHENPAVAPNFCMLLRKHLMPSRLISVLQPEFERVIILTFECQTELYDRTEKKLIIEIMGHFSNIIFVDDKNLIIDAIRHVDFTTSSKRQILPGLIYELPPKQDKVLVTEDSLNFDFSGENRADKFLTDKYLGFSPLISREIVFLATGQTDTRLCEFSQSQRDKFVFYLKNICDNISSFSFSPCVITDKKPLEFYCFPIYQYGPHAVLTKFDTFSQAIDEFYFEKDEQEHIKRLSGDILRVITNAQNRILKKIEAQKIDIKEYEKALSCKDLGDIITANIYALSQGMHKAILTDYTKDPPCDIEIELNPSITPANNAQRYYKRYKKAVTALEILKNQIPESEKELIYLDSVFDELVRAKNSTEIDEIRTELIESGYIKQHESRKNPKKPKAYNPKLSKVVSTDGYNIYIGKNNLQNDYLTLKFAEKSDIWFHVKNYPGSHVVVSSKGEEIPETTLNEAAVLAAKNSKASDGGTVAVDYTEIRYIKKPKNAKPGMVVYTVYKTAYIKL